MTQPTEAPLLSVVVCTYNRSRLMAQAVRSLIAQDLEPHRWELLVVDNRSDDDTATVCQQLAEERPGLQYLYEPQQGLSHARNCGWRAARGEYVGYLDDDAQALPGWLAAAADIAETLRPAAFGGPYTPFYESAKPDWFKDAYESRGSGDRARFLGPDEDLSGGNMFVRRDLLSEVGGYNPRLGMAGEDLGYGEETELQLQLRRADPEARILYDPRLRILHLARADKLSLGWRARRIFANGRTQARRSTGPTPATPALLGELGLSLAKLAGRLTLRLATRDRARYPAWQNYVYEDGLNHLRPVGTAVEHLLRKL